MKASKKQDSASPIPFKAELSKVDTLTIIRLPKGVSIQLPSRGMVMVEGTLNGSRFQAPLEPDGQGSHWLEVDKSMIKDHKVGIGDTVLLEIRPSSEWPEPCIPDDFQSALANAPQEFAVWKDSTTIARWDWIRWINSTKSKETRAKRIEVALSKMRAGSRRPCCFDRAKCTNPYVSKSGVLLSPTV